jgi:metal-responsive CopG/Arc/MetJ family transcriptional regulator
MSERISVSLPEVLYESLAEIAFRKNVSVAWVIREASYKYVDAILANNNPESPDND